MYSILFPRSLKSRFLFTVFLFLTLSIQFFSQSSENYSFSTNTTGSLIADLNGNPIDLTGEANLIGNSYTYTNSAFLPIGFNFYFMGTKYDTLTVNSGGNVGMGTRSLSASQNNNLVLPDYQPPIIAPFWDYIRTATSGHSVRMKTIGSPPNRCCVIEWHSRINANSVTNPYDGIFQLRLYETSGIIEFVYGEMNVGSTSGIVTASIGFTTGKTDNSMISITELATFSIARTTSEVVNNLVNSSVSGNITGLHSSSDGSRRVFTFTPYTTTPSAPITMTFPNVYGTGMQIQWIDNSATETFFKIYRSTDNVNFTYVGSVSSSTRGSTATAYTYNGVGLTESTTYYWKISAANEASPESDYLTGSQVTAASSLLSGTKTVGPGGDYESLTVAILDIQLKGLSGNFDLELKSTYNSSVETFPLVFQSINTSASKTLTIYPQTDATGLSITSDNYFKTIELSAQSYIVFDGRPGKSGTSIQLTIANTNLNGIALRFYFYSSFNILRYCNITGVTNLVSSGVISFIQPEGNSGTNNNIIEYCNIHSGTTTPNNLIYNNGLPASATANKNNIVQYCNIYDFYSDGGVSRGIYLTNGASSWTINNNSFFQTTPRYPEVGITTMTPIEIDDYSAFNHKIYENYIGGSAPKLGGDSMFVFASTVYRTVFRGIYINTSSSSLNSIQGNRISRIRFQSVSSSSGSALFRGIQCNAGIYSIGDTTGNIIGGISGNDSLIITTTSTSSANIKFIDISGYGGNIKNNIIGAIRLYLLTNNLQTVHGIYTSSYLSSTHPLVISGNRIGHSTDLNSIHINITSTPVDFVGIFSQAYNSGSLTINNNLISNISHNTSSFTATSRICGIYVSPPSWSSDPTLSDLAINENSVYKLSSLGTNVNTGTAAAVSGIVNGHSPALSLYIRKNTIHSLFNSNSSWPVWVVGITNSDTVAPTNFCDKNSIHHIGSAYSSSDAYIIGIYHIGKNSLYADNMIQLGFDADGNNLTIAANVIGIYDNGKDANVYFNSIYIGGESVVAGSPLSSCIRRNSDTNPDDYRNNIFQNNRTNAVPATNHYCINYSGVTNLTSDYNIFYPSGTGVYLGYVNSAGYLTFPSYQTEFSLDMHGGSGNPGFIAPAGNVSAVDLHITSPTVIEASGIAVAQITEDFDSQTRASLTPVDIGADAGTFTLTDVISPVISFNQLGKGSTANRVLTNFSTITDNLTVATGDNLPRLYFKKSTDNNTFGGNTSDVNGWKYVVGSASGNVYSFTIDYSLIFGGIVAIGNTVQYFIAAQDAVPNFSSLPNGATGTVNNISSAPITPYSYQIVATISGSKTIGAGGDYAGLTTSGGFFDDLNSKTLDGNLEIKITSNLTSETGAVSLLPFNEIGIGGEYKVKILPDAAVNRQISGNVAGALIKLDGTDNFTLDGRFNGSGNYLTFVNSNTAGAVLKILNDAHHDTIKFCNIYGANLDTSLGLIYINEGVSTGNSYISITDNILGEAELSLDKDITKNIETIYPFYTGIVVQSVGSHTKSNSHIEILRNHFVNIQYYGINCSGGGRYYTISYNHFYRNRSITDTRDLVLIYLGGGTYSYGHTISYNYIGGSTSNCGGSPFVIPGDVAFYGIYVSSGRTAPGGIHNNSILNILHSNPSTTKSFNGIKTEGGIYNIGKTNLVGSTIPSQAIQINGGGFVTGINIQNTQSVVEENTVYNLWQTPDSRGVITGINVEGAQAVSLTCNFIGNLGPINSNNPSVSAVNGINTSTGSSTSPVYITNNLILLGDNVQSYALYNAIQNGRWAGTLFCANNTVHIQGQANSSSIKGSACSRNYFESAQNLNSYLLNNILYNNRTGGTGGHYAVCYEYGMYSNITSNNNLFVTPNNSRVCKSGSSDYSFQAYKDLNYSYRRDVYSMYSQSTDLLPSNLWTDPSNLNYTPNASDPLAWALNGQGQPSSYVPNDRNGNSRSTSPSTGTTDLGSAEFNSTADPPTIVGTPDPVPNGTTSFSAWGKPVADIIWNSEGVQPVSVTLDFFPGKNPPNATSTNPNAQYANQYHILNLNGGSGYIYDFKVYFDPNQRGKIVNIANSRLARWYTDAWQQYINSYYHDYYSYVRANGIPGPGTEANQSLLFAIGSSDNPLPVELNSFLVKPVNRNAELHWSTATELNSAFFEIERQNIGNSTAWIALSKIPAAGFSNSSREYSYVDKRLNSGRYSYRIKLIDNTGEFSYSDVCEIEIGKPTAFALIQNYPNPFNSHTKIEYNVPVNSHIKIELYNITGELLYIIVDNIFEAGFYSVLMNTNDVTRGLASGVYFYRIIALDENNKLNYANVKKLVYLK